MRLASLACVLGLLLAWPLTAGAQELEDVIEAPRVFSIQERPYRLGHEFQLGLGVLPMNAFYVGTVASASYTYHFTDFWAWEIAGAGYSFNIDTSLEGELREDYDVAPVGGGGERIHLLATTSLVAKPLFGKLAIFNSDIVHSETFFTSGIGLGLKGKYPRPAAVLGLGLRFWSTDVLSWRFDVRDYLVFSGLSPENVLLLLVSASFNVFEAEAPNAAAPLAESGRSVER